ncbi:MAG: ferredoxin--NADP reductase [Geothrix sp.]|uniref:ferredoxin--NADP reductase n=1 Tax=Geothrix sp. TaxID=1962974 RepID=UPI00184E20F5|nr:ferredoxin--NADP reductase [Geothrix sp.]NWJ41978.1 ferredoxin--NADP reductase [Geothrix sp.]WIL20049.1 MAG: ferredoxin--NADP reductase [Geothrix sp.]
MPEANAIVTQRIDSAPGLMVLRVAPAGWELPAFSPGQFAVLGLPTSAPRSPGAEPEEPALPPDAFLRRAYSIASSSLEHQYLEFYLVEVKSGALTPRLFNLKPGDKLWLGPKFTGMFTLDEVPTEQNVVFIATGTGLAPYMSMLRTHLARDGRRRFAVIHGARNSWDLGYRDELVQMQRLAPNFHYLPVLTRPATELAPWTGHTGRLPAFWAEGVLARTWGFRPAPADTHIFLCGNPDMLTTLQGQLEAEGFREHTKKAPGQIHLEKYW